MPGRGSIAEPELHRELAVSLFNHVWELLEKDDRTKAEDERMLHAAHASRFHWGEVGEPLNLAIGDWQISRAYAALNRPQSSLHHARRCLEIIEENDVGGFHLASAYEGMARAYSVAGRMNECRRYIELAKTEGEQLRDREERKVLFGQLRELPGYRD